MASRGGAGRGSGGSTAPEKGSDTEYQQLLSRIPPKFFSRTNFNAFEYYHDDHELDMVAKTVNDAVGLIVDRCYRAFNGATTSFRHVLQTFNESQDAIKQLQLDVTEGQRILFTTNRNLKDLFHQQMTHEQVLKILTKIEVVTRIPQRIASYLSRHQYYRAVILLLYALDLLNTPELRQITALHPVRDDLLLLKQDLQRVLYVELKGLIFLSDPRLRQSVIDDASPSDLNQTGSNSNNNNSKNQYQRLPTASLNTDPLFSNLGIKTSNNSLHLSKNPNAPSSAGKSGFRFTGSSTNVEQRYRPGFGHFHHVVGDDNVTDPFGNQNTNTTIGNSNPFNYNESITKSSLARRQRQRKNLYSLETLGNAHDDDIAIPPTMETLRSNVFPPFIDVLTPLRSDVIYDSHPHTKTGTISYTDTTAALQSYLATHGYSFGELQDEEFTEDDTSLMPFLLLCENALDAEDFSLNNPTAPGVGADLDTLNPALSPNSNSNAFGRDSSKLGPRATPTLQPRQLVGESPSLSPLNDPNSELTPQLLLNKAKSVGSNWGEARSNLSSDPTSPLSNNAQQPFSKAPQRPTPRKGTVYHARYQYRLLALENTSTYIADPLSHPDEYMTILIETLHLLNYLPSVEQRLAKQTADSIRQLVSREINALAAQVISLSLQSYHQSSYAWRGAKGMTQLIGKMSNHHRNHNNKQGSDSHHHNQPSTTRPCSPPQSHHDPNNPFAQNIVQHYNVITALLPWQNSARDAYDEPSRNNSTKSRFGGSSPYDSSGDEDEKESSLTAQEKRRMKRKARATAGSQSIQHLRGGSVWSQFYKDERDPFNLDQTILQGVVKILQKDINFQAQMLSDLLVVICKLSVQVLINHKQALTHITALKNIRMYLLEQEMSIEEYHQTIVDAYTKPDTLINVHESTRRAYNYIQIQIQQMLWRFWEKQQLPLIFSIDDEITTQILNNTNYSRYKSNANSNFLGLNSLSTLNPFSSHNNIFSNIQNLTPQQFIQQLFHSTTNVQRASCDSSGSISSYNTPTNTMNANNATPHSKTEAQDKEENLKFSFFNSRTQSIARQEAQTEFGPKDYESEARQRAQRLREQRRKDKATNVRSSMLSGDIDDEWYDVDDDDDNDLLRSDQEDKTSWLTCSPHHVSLVYLPILHFADMCNSLVDGVDHCPYLPAPPMYQLFPHLLTSNASIAKFTHQLNRRYARYEQSLASISNKTTTMTVTTTTSGTNVAPSTTSTTTMTNTNNTGNSSSSTALVDPATTTKVPSMMDFLIPIIDLRTAITARLKYEEEQRAAKLLSQPANKKTAAKKDDKKFSAYDLLPRHVAHLIPQIQHHALNTVGTVKDALHLNRPEAVTTASVNVQPRLLGPSVINSITNTTIWVRTNIFQPYPLPSVHSLLQNTSLNTSFLHSSYPLTQCLALAIQDIFLPRLHNDIIHSIERILNSPYAFKPFDNTTSNSSLLGPQTSINLTQYEMDPTATTDGANETGTAQPLSTENNEKVDSITRRQSMANVFSHAQAQAHTSLNQADNDDAATAQIEANIILGSVSTTDFSVQQLYRVMVSQQAAYETNEPFKRLYHFFANIYKGTLSSQLLVENLLLDPDYFSNTARTAAAVQSSSGINSNIAAASQKGDSVLSHQHYAQQHSKQRRLSSAIGLTTGNISQSERQLPSTVTGLLRRLRVSPHFTGNKSMVIIRCAYDMSLLLEALSQDMCLLPQFSHHIMTLFQHAIDSFVERVQIKYMEVTQIASSSQLFTGGVSAMYSQPTSPTIPVPAPMSATSSVEETAKTTVYPTQILTNKLHIDAMASDLWFLDFRGIPRSNKQHTHLYAIAKDRLLAQNRGQFSSVYDKNGPKGYYDASTALHSSNPFNVSGHQSVNQATQGRLRSASLVGANSLGLKNNATITTTNKDGTTTTTTQASTSGLQQRLLDPICEFYIDTFFSSHNPVLQELLSPDFVLNASQLFHQTPLDLTTNNTMLRMQQSIPTNESSGLVSLLFGNDKSKENQKTIDAIKKFQKANQPDATDNDPNSINTADANLNSLNMASAITSRAQGAIKPLSYMALLANSLDWLSNFLYHLSIPGNRPISLAEAASTTTSKLPATNKQTVMSSNFAASPSQLAAQHQARSISSISSFSVQNPQNRDVGQPLLQESPSLLDFVSLQQHSQSSTFQFNQQLTLIPLYDSNSTGLGNILSVFSKHQNVGYDLNPSQDNNGGKIPILQSGLASVLPQQNNSNRYRANPLVGSMPSSQPLMMVPGSLTHGIYIPLLANLVPSCYQSSQVSSTQAIYESIAQDMSGGKNYVGGLSAANGFDTSLTRSTIGGTSTSNTTGFTTGSALGSGDINPYGSSSTLQTSALDNATSVLRSYTSLISVFISPTYSTLFSTNQFNPGIENNDSAVTTTTTTDGQTTTTTTTTTNNNKKGAKGGVPPGVPGVSGNPNISTNIGNTSNSAYNHFFDLSLGNGMGSSYSMNDLIASSITQPLLQYNPLDSYQSTLALSRCLALTKMLPDAAQVRMYVTEEAALRYLDEEKWRGYLVWNGYGPGSVNPTSNLGALGTEIDENGNYALSSHQQELENAKRAKSQQQTKNQEQLLSQAVSSLSSTEQQLSQFYSLLSMKRFELSHKLYELANTCMFTIKLEIICRVVFHLKYSVLSNYNIKPTLFTNQNNGNGLDFKAQYKKYQNQQRTQFIKALSNNTLSISNKNAMNLLFQNIDTEHYILELNKDLTTIEESLARFWDSNRIHYVFGGISHLVSSLLIRNFGLMPVKLVTPLGIKCIHRNLHSLQQTLSNSLLPTHHSLSLVTAFPQYYHHHPQYNDLQFARVREYADLMKCTLTSLPTQAQQRLFKFTETEFATLIEIITNNHHEKAKHQRALKAQKQLLISTQLARQRLALDKQQETQRDVNRANNSHLDKERLEQEQRDRANKVTLEEKAKRQQEKDDKRAQLAAQRAEIEQMQAIEDAKPDEESSSDDDKPKGSPLVDLSHWTTIDKDVKIERKRGPLGQTTISTTKTTVIKTGTGDGPQGSTGVQVGVGGGVHNTTAALLTNNAAKGTPQQQHQIIVKTSEESPSNEKSSVSKFWSRFRSK